MADVQTPRPVEAPRDPLARAATMFVWVCIWLGCWGVIAGGVLLTVSRAFDVTRAIRMLIGQGVTPFVYFAVWPVAALAAWRRRWILTGVSLALMAVHIAVTLPAVWPHGAPGWAAKAPHLRVLVANVKADNPTQVQAARLLGAQDVDAIVLVEITDAWVGALQNAGVEASFPYHVSQPDSFSARGAAVYARVPVEAGPVIDLDRGRKEPSAVFTLDGGTKVTIFAIHLVSPYARSREERWRDNFTRLVDAVPTVRGPFVFAGDFNATRWHPFFGKLLDAGLTDAHERNGKGLTRSWPADRPHGVPPVMRLDHALMSAGVAATAVRDLSIPGSDHRGFIVDLAVKPG